LGDGWDGVVAELRGRGFQINHLPGFDLAAYRALMPTLDYYLYLGTDEGSMGFIDALAAGVPTIVTPQGFHLDAPDGLVHPFTSAEELCSVFEGIAAGRKRLTDAVAGWGWRDYAVKHRDLWEYLLSGTRAEQTGYRDGLASLGESPPIGLLARGRARLKYIKSSIRMILWQKR
jgi:hypothetical protein